MKKFSKKFIAIFFVLYILSTTVFAATVVAADVLTGEDTSVSEGEKTEEKDEAVPEETKPEITISSEHLSVTQGRKIELTATVTGVSAQPEIRWTSSDEKVATVNEKGVVRGIKAGKTIITASAVVEGEEISAQYALNVVTSTNFIKDFLENRQVLSYQYSYEDDYYYTNDKEAWQYNFGYGPIYDIAAPYVLLEYDYVRVFFEYQNKDWMIQLWKGQYGLVFYGSEVGVYNKEHTDKEDNIFTFYKCPPEEDWMKMEMTLYHENLNGEYEREFTRPYDTYWWCTGFKDGHLRVEEPADELRMISRLTLKDEEMTKLFTQGLKDCGFTQTRDKDAIGTDMFYVEGSDVYINWQNINEAENTMPIKVGVGFVTAANIISLLLAILSFFSVAFAAIFFFI